MFGMTFILEVLLMIILGLLMVLFVPNGFEDDYPMVLDVEKVVPKGCDMGCVMFDVMLCVMPYMLYKEV